MNSEEAFAAAQLMVAFADPGSWSGLLECRIRDGEWQTWDDTIPLWDWYRYEYRHKPTPELRPYTGEELAGMMGAEVKAVDRVFFISAVTLRLGCVPKILLTRTEAGFCERNGYPEWLLDHYTHIDGSPCGVEVETSTDI